MGLDDPANGRCILLISLAIFHAVLPLSWRGLQARCQALVARINAQQGLIAFDAGHLLGYPAPTFLVFDSRNRKIAACDVVNDAYKLHDFSWLLGWQMTWREVEGMEMNGGSRQVNASGMSVPTFERTVRAKDFAIELQTADPQRPVLRFPMSRRAAETWCARLNTIFNLDNLARNYDETLPELVASAFCPDGLCND